MGRRHALAAAVALLAAASVASGQTCGNIDAKFRGASGNGVTSDGPVFVTMDNEATTGIIYLTPGTYRIGSSITINTPIMGEDGSKFYVDSGVTLTITNQPEHPLTTFFDGPGTVQFGEGCVRSFPEWFKVGSGADDAPAIREAYAAAAATGNAMLYLTGTYGIGSEIQFPAKATIMSEPTARFKSVGGNGRGVTFITGGYAYKNVLPHLEGFSSFCMRMVGSDLGAFQLQTLTSCGDAIRFETVLQGDKGTVLDNTVWFDKITNARNGIVFAADVSCEQTPGQLCVMQGNHVVGNTIEGGASSGDTRAIAFFYAGRVTPAWDSNQAPLPQINIRTVTPHATNVKYAFMHCDPGSSIEIVSNRMVIKVANFGKLPGPNSQGVGKMFTGAHNMLQATINLAAPLPEDGLNLAGQLNLIELTGQTTPLPGTDAIQTTNAANSKRLFNPPSNKALVGNYFSFIFKPDSDWQPGEIRQTFAYHQLAIGALYQIKCNAPRQPSTGLPIAQDNSGVPAAAGGSGVRYEIALWLINMSGTIIPRGAAVPFTLAVATLGAAP
eukprot:scaffold18.g1982.t1